MSKAVANFMNFIREQGVVGLAVGLTVGVAVTAFVNSFVTNIINPIIGMILPGTSNLGAKYICLDSVDGICTNKLNWGIAVSSLISFLTIALVVYFVVHGLRLDRLDRKREK
ncbi:hypothetical protein A2884_00160 [Candidatus Saccharibacteria bacterium RIFCSPHIGHO2_01_FULL_48_12]|nr:MAG: hypothetical protein A2884_00160 [Candidatus Saccharibacteria bacterium RIFCSPHIGHO2_01_FULL_48_12]